MPRTVAVLAALLLSVRCAASDDNDSAAASWPPRAVDVPAWVISLKRTPKRWERFAAGGVPQRALPRLRVFDAVDGSKLDYKADDRFAVSSRVAIRRGARRSHTDLSTLGMAGLYISHVEVWKAALAEMRSTGAQLALVLEDDAVVTPDLPARMDGVLAALPPPAEFDLWLLGTVRVASSAQARGMPPGMHEVREYFGTQAYAVTRRGIERLLRLAYPMTVQVDAFLSGCTSLGLARALWHAGGAADVPQFFLAGTTVQEFYCSLCDLPDDYSRLQDVVLWLLVGALLAKALPRAHDVLTARLGCYASCARGLTSLFSRCSVAVKAKARTAFEHAAEV